MRSRTVALVLLLVAAALPSAAAQRQVTLLYTNDIESVYEPVEAFWNPDIARTFLREVIGEDDA